MPQCLIGNAALGGDHTEVAVDHRAETRIVDAARDLTRFPVQLVRAEQIATAVRDDRSAVRGMRLTGEVGELLGDLRAALVQAIGLGGVSTLAMGRALPTKDV